MKCLKSPRSKKSKNKSISTLLDCLLPVTITPTTVPTIAPMRSKPINNDNSTHGIVQAQKDFNDRHLRKEKYANSIGKITRNSTLVVFSHRILFHTHRQKSFSLEIDWSSKKINEQIEINDHRWATWSDVERSLRGNRCRSPSIDVDV